MNNTNTIELADLQTRSFEQFNQFKQQHPDYLLLFRVGDFYKCYNQDAAALNRICGTKVLPSGAGQGVTVASVPFDGVEKYLRRIIASGKRVAICEAK